MRRRSGQGGKTGTSDAGSVEAVLDELYTTPPSDFVSRREERAAAARTDGRKDDARLIHAARRPTLAAWAANLLARSQPEESRRFLELGQSLREAHRTLDAAGLRELSAQRRRIVTALSRQAAHLADEAGHRLSQGAQREVESTLRAVLADQEAADRWSGGRLEVALAPPSEFPSATSPAAPATPAPAPRKEPAGTGAEDELAERRRKRQEDLARAEQEAERAAERLRDAQARQADAETLLRRTDGEHDRAREALSAAEDELRAAREDLDRTGRERRDAEEAARTARKAVTGAEREARTAARRVDRLVTRVGQRDTSG
ncbi:hypothetical protein DMH12_08815 [Streptomyces sp. WAC 04229]|uniref:hypothetical protein n=1 Tax=Streptomyces sp. WAC 04229 TaxID=2203206 RepID=UPI000F73FAAC|nr:hypothetical protein [Streptomyces sp. WAC 04229]RSN60106.1 hypothetical protein DMH12_08815 [Streptomyces sp. WAC 04229]